MRMFNRWGGQNLAGNLKNLCRVLKAQTERAAPRLPLTLTLSLRERGQLAAPLNGSDAACQADALASTGVIISCGGLSYLVVPVALGGWQMADGRWQR